MDEYEVGLGGPLVVLATVLALVSASSLPGIPLCPGTHKRVVGPGRALRSYLRWRISGDRRSIVLRSDSKSAHIVSEWLGWLAVAQSKVSCMVDASSASDEVNAAPHR